MQKLQTLFFILLFSFITSALWATELHPSEEHEKKESFDATEMIMEHIMDTNEWHLFTTTDKNGHQHHYSIPLPIIIWDGELKVFMSNKIAHGHDFKGYTLKHSQLHSLENKQKATFIDLFSSLEGKYIDFSITKNILAFFISMLLLLFLFITMAKSYSKTGLRPKGIAGFLEPIVVFVRDEIAIPNIGKNKYEKYLPYLLTVFFFIWINNLLGLLPIFPGGANVTGNIAVTMVLALFTMLIVNFNGSKSYWKHIVKPPGIPVFMLPIIIPVEIIGIFTKPFALMIRLFANITAGHIMILSLMSLMFIFRSTTVSFGAIPMAIFMSILELLVSVLQAYIFTVLSALFIGLAVKNEEH